MRVINVESDQTATPDMLRNGNVLVCATGVDLVLPYPSSDFTNFVIKALGPNVTIQSAAGIEDTAHSVVTTPITLSDGDARQLFSVRDHADGTQSAYRLGVFG